MELWSKAGGEDVRCRFLGQIYIKREVTLKEPGKLYCVTCHWWGVVVQGTCHSACFWARAGLGHSLGKPRCWEQPPDKHIRAAE